MNKPIQFYMLISDKNNIDIKTALHEMKRIVGACSIGLPLDYEKWVLSYVHDQRRSVSYVSYPDSNYSMILYFESDKPEISQEAFQSLFENTRLPAEDVDPDTLSGLPELTQDTKEVYYKAFMPGFPSVYEKLLKEKGIAYDPQEIYAQSQKTLSILKPLFPTEVRLPLKLAKDIQFDVDGKFDVYGWIDPKTKPWNRLSVTLKYNKTTAYRGQHIFIDCTFRPDKKHEEKGCAFRIHIPGEIWQYADQEKLITAFRESCKEMDASFGCINCDEPRWRLEECPYVYLHADSDEEDFLDRIPGIFWAQWVNESLIKNTGSIQWVCENAPYELKKTYDTQSGKYLWMQSAGDIDSFTYEKKLLIRAFFEESLYALDMKNIFDTNKYDIQRWQQMTRTESKHLRDKLKSVPLTKEEIRELKLLSKKQTEEIRGDSSSDISH